MQVCSRCGLDKPLAKHRTICGDCNLVRKREVAARKYNADPELLRCRSRAWRAAHPERAAEIDAKAGAKYYETNGPAIRERASIADRASRDGEPVTERLRELASMTPDARVERDRALRSAYVAGRHVKNPVPVLVWSAMGRARRFGVPFDADIRKPAAAAWERGTCELSGIAFSGIGKQSPFSMSIDRITPVKGYVQGNIRFVCWWLNAACGSWGLEVILPAMRAIIDKAPKPDV